MVDYSMVAQLLRSKLPDQSEIELHLFEFCNLKCYFCGQDHDDKSGMDLISAKIPRIQNFIKNNPQKNHILNIMGGEIFNDQIEDHLFEEYCKLAIDVNEYAKSIGHNCHFNWVTNLVFKKRDRVINFLDKLKARGISTKLSTSYDFTGRKNKTWIEDLFKANIDYFIKDIYTVGFVLSKPAIQFLLYDHDEYFDYLYKNFPLYFDFYVPEAGAKQLMPSDEDLLMAYRFIAATYPKVSPVKELLENSVNKMTCYSLNKLTLLPDNKEVKCRYLKYKDDDFQNPVDYMSNDNIIYSYIEENQCLSCLHYDRCSFRCFVQADWAKREKATSCVFKTFFDEKGFA